MKLPFFAVVLFASLLFAIAAASETRHNEVTIQLPPETLAQWYRPQNKRQVWLHTMFRLRQSVQAVAHYAARDDHTRLDQWAAELERTYASLLRMVPEWEEQIRPSLAGDVLEAAKSRDRRALGAALDALERKCEGCHRQWKGVVTALYRSPDYTEVRVAALDGERETDFLEAMENLADTLNALKTAREDGELAAARGATRRLTVQLRQLGTSCDTCHRDTASSERILGPATFASLEALEAALRAPHDAKASGHHLGTVGFTVCGRCHSVHRTLSDLRERLLR